jgi:hypothetical protein
MRNTLNGLFSYLKKVNLVKITSKIFGNWIIIKNIIKKDGKIRKNIILKLLIKKNKISGIRLYFLVFIVLNERKVATINCRTIQTT